MLWLGTNHERHLSSPVVVSLRLVSVAKLVDFERGQVSCADLIGITVLSRG
jgi:hypothetical protein